MTYRSLLMNYLIFIEGKGMIFIGETMQNAQQKRVRKFLNLISMMHIVMFFTKTTLVLFHTHGLSYLFFSNLRRLYCPYFVEYYKMILDKTGGLFRLAVGLMQSFAAKHKDTDFTPLVNNLGLYFQIRDDLINLSDEEYFKSKSFCEDLTEGKFSFPIIHYIHHSDENDTRLLSILKQRTEDLELKKYAQGLMKEAGSLQYTRDKCIELKGLILDQIKELGGNAPLTKLIELLDIQVEKLADAVKQVPTSDKKIDST